jgi:hypothetical protein
MICCYSSKKEQPRSLASSFARSAVRTTDLPASSSACMHVGRPTDRPLFFRFWLRRASFSFLPSLLPSFHSIPPCFPSFFLRVRKRAANERACERAAFEQKGKGLSRCCLRTKRSNCGRFILLRAMAVSPDAFDATPHF